MHAHPLARRALAASLLVVAVLLAVPGTPARAAASGGNPVQQPPPTGPGSATTPLLRIESVSPFVAADGTFEVRFAPASLPVDATFSYTVHQSLVDEGDGLAASLDQVLDGGSPGPILRGPVEVPLADLGDQATGPTLQVPIRPDRGARSAVFVPGPGLHPVVLRVDDAAGRRLWGATVWLNRLPADPVVDPGGGPGVQAVTLVVPIDGPPAIGPDGEADLDPATRADVASATALLTATPDVPLVVALRPNVLSGVVRSGSAADEAFLQVLRDRVVRDPLPRRPDVRVDVAGLLDAGAGDLFFQQLQTGDRVLRDATGAEAVGTTWWFDETLDDRSVSVLAGLGVARVVLPAESLRVAGATDDDNARTRAVGLQGTTITASAVDPRLTLRLTDTRIEPGLRANQVTAALLSAWFTAAEAGPTSFPGPATALVVPPGTDPGVVRALLPSFSGGPLSTSPEAVPTTAARVGGRPLVAALAPREPADQRAPVAEARATRTLIESFRQMAGTGEPDLVTWELLNAETLSTQLDPAQRTRLHEAVRDQVDSRVARIGMPPERRVVLTGREASIPLRFRNDLPYPVQVIVRARSPRLEVAGDDTKLVRLDPGENRVDLDVTVRAPGAALLRIDARSPDGRIEIGRSDLPVTSTTISGVGAALSVVSLLVLAGWWLLTVRRSRRRAARGSHPSGAGPAGTDDPGPAEESGAGSVGDSG